MGKEDLKPIRQELFEIRVKLNTEGLSKEERNELETRLKEVRKKFAMTAFKIKEGEMENEKYQGR